MIGLLSGAMLAGVVQANPPSPARAVPEPRLPLGNLVSADDYPEGVSRSAAADVGVRLAVGPDGRVTACSIARSSGTAMLDAASCRLLRYRARFRPATDATGAPTRGDYQAVIDWRAILRGGGGRPGAATGNPRISLAPWESISSLRFAGGQLVSCQQRRGGIAPPPPSANACQNPQLAGLAYGLARENGARGETMLTITLRMTGAMLEPLRAQPAALADLAADLEIGADGMLSSCRFVRATLRTVRNRAAQRPDCRRIFPGPYVAATDRAGRPVAVTKRAEMRIVAE